MLAIPIPSDVTHGCRGWPSPRDLGAAIMGESPASGRRAGVRRGGRAFGTRSRPMFRQKLTVETRGRGTHEITRQVQQVVEHSGVTEGLCNVFIHHTSASLIVCENADP